MGVAGRNEVREFDGYGKLKLSIHHHRQMAEKTMDKTKQAAIDFVFDTIKNITNESSNFGKITSIGRVKGQIELLTHTHIISIDEASDLYDKLAIARKDVEDNM